MFFRQSSYFSPGNFSVSEIKRNNIQVAANGMQSLKMDDKIYIFNSSKGYEEWGQEEWGQVQNWYRFVIIFNDI